MGSDGQIPGESRPCNARQRYPRGTKPAKPVRKELGSGSAAEESGRDPQPVGDNWANSSHGKFQVMSFSVGDKKVNFLGLHIRLFRKLILCCLSFWGAEKKNNRTPLVRI
ncbi:hypothetical protein PgNI_06091 [Pyricularia grisea]|uniref:Uncharacterized protein n=1 Tax=Pyricularia grisea TaxID=148305 RepID=A0A6P8B7F1_PYRGI|nr:hypothetical protein PgNI_06091 [Pyricularia grisea]TLD11173.1 hypothetical protein PgNI_06091 [Pyricularia grisea]